MEEKKALVEGFDLSGLRLGMTVYHPNVGFGREPVKLYGVRVSAKGDSAQVELKYADGSCLWEDIGGLSTIPDFENLCDARDLALEMNSKLLRAEKIGIATIETLVDHVLKLTDRVSDAKRW